jgi:hypothetical protein
MDDQHALIDHPERFEPLIGSLVRATLNRVE